MDDPKPNESRTRMISFRLTTEEYNRFHALCLARGIHLSEVVRSAIKHILSQESPGLYQDSVSHLHTRIERLESRLNTLESEADSRHASQSPGLAPATNSA